MLASSMLINRTGTLHGGPVRWLFFRTMTILRDFTAKPTHSPAVFTLWVCIPIHLPLSHPFCSHWTNLQGVASQIVWHIPAIAAWRVMQTLEVWADTKSCRDTSHLFKDYLVNTAECQSVAEPTRIGRVGCSLANKQSFMFHSRGILLMWVWVLL